MQTTKGQFYWKPEDGFDPLGQPLRDGVRSGGIVLGLVSNVALATRIAQAAKICHLDSHNFDKGAPLVEFAKKRRPVLVIFDWDSREAEAFRVLKDFRENADLSGIATVGCVSQGKADLKKEAERAGCHRAYFKTEFLRSLIELMTRYAS